MMSAPPQAADWQKSYRDGDCECNEAGITPYQNCYILHIYIVAGAFLKTTGAIVDRVLHQPVCSAELEE
jgi:hypothetical protein